MTAQMGPGEAREVAVMMRPYSPQAAMLNGTWAPPTVTRA